MNPFRYSLNRKRFSSARHHFQSDSIMSENSRDFHGFIVVRSLLNVFGVERAIWIGGTIHSMKDIKGSCNACPPVRQVLKTR